MTSKGYSKLKDDGYMPYTASSSSTTSSSLSSSAAVLATAPGQFKHYWNRWLMLFLLCQLNISNAAQWIEYAPVADSIQSYYGVSSTWVNLLSQSFMILYIPFGFVASWALDTKGLRFAVNLGAALNFIGAGIKYIANFVEITPSADPNLQFGIVMFGQLFAAAAQPFILGAPTKLAATWFGEKQRATANMLASMSNPIGIAVANVLSPVFVTTDAPWGVNTMHWVYAIPALECLVLSLLFMKSTPPTPPSASAEEKTDSFSVGLRKVVSNKPYLLLLSIFGVGLAIFNAVSTLLEQIVSPHGYSDDDAGTFGACLIGAGLIGAGVCAPILDRTKAYRAILRTCFIFAAASFVGFAIAVRPDQFVAIAITSGAIGFFTFPLLPVCLELAVEVTYPVSEGTSASLMWIVGQGLGVVFIFIMNAMATGPNDDMTNALWFVVACIAAMVIPAFLFRSEYHRLNMEQAREKSSNGGINSF